jgi:hypothetical protein
MTKTQKSLVSFEDRLVQVGAEGAVAAVTEAGTAAEQLIDRWTASANAAAILEVSEHGEGAPRKAARRALGVLRSRKVPIPPLRRVAMLARDASEEIVEAWMMAPDSSGMQLFALSSRPASGRHKAAFVYLHGAQGVARVENSVFSQTQLKDYFAKIMPGSGYGATKVAVEWARFRIADARRAHKERNLPEPLGLTTAASLIEPVPAAAPPHPFDEEGFELAAEDAADLAKGSALLHNVPEFRGWLPTNASMQELLIHVGEKLTPGETPEPGVVTTHLLAEVAAATDRFFTPDVREEMLRRMKDSALSVLAREGEQRALEIAATMQVISRCGLVTNPPRDVPFLKGFFDKAVALMVAQGNGRLRIPMAAGAAPATADVPEGAPVDGQSA